MLFSQPHESVSQVAGNITTQYNAVLRTRKSNAKIIHLFISQTAAELLLVIHSVKETHDIYTC